MDHYEVLGVDPSASTAQVRAAYLDLARRYHPDRTDDDGEQMLTVNEAFAVLRDPDQRDAYDRSRRAQATAGWKPGSPTPDFVPFDDGDDPDDPAADYDIPYGDGSPLPRSVQMAPAALVVAALVALTTGALLGFAPLLALGLIAGVAALLGFIGIPMVMALRIHLRGES